MKSYGIIPCYLWNDHRFEDLSPTSKLIMLYVLSYPYAHISGLFQLPLKHVISDTGLKRIDVKDSANEINESGLSLWNVENGWIGVFDWIKYNPPKNRNLRNGIRKHLNEHLPEDTFIDEAIEIIREKFEKNYGIDFEYGE